MALEFAGSLDFSPDVAPPKINLGSDVKSRSIISPINILQAVGNNITISKS